MSTNREDINNLSNKELSVLLRHQCYIGLDGKIKTEPIEKKPEGDSMEIHKWLSQESKDIGLTEEEITKDSMMFNLNYNKNEKTENKTWYIHRTSEKRNCELYIFIIANCCLSTNETSGDKFKRSYFTKSDAIKIRDILNKKREGKTYLWIVSNDTSKIGTVPLKTEANKNYDQCEEKTADQMFENLGYSCEF